MTLLGSFQDKWSKPIKQIYCVSFLLFKIWRLHYPQRNLATGWHHWMRFDQVTCSFLWSLKRLFPTNYSLKPDSELECVSFLESPFNILTILVNWRGFMQEAGKFGNTRQLSSNTIEFCLFTNRAIKKNGVALERNIPTAWNGPEKQRNTLFTKNNKNSVSSSYTMYCFQGQYMKKNIYTFSAKTLKGEKSKNEENNSSKMRRITQTRSPIWSNGFTEFNPLSNRLYNEALI